VIASHHPLAFCRVANDLLCFEDKHLSKTFNHRGLDLELVCDTIDDYPGVDGMRLILGNARDTGFQGTRKLQLAPGIKNDPIDLGAAATV